jgi:multisubunit Na+/H+ antiporter MnhG subunit
MRERIVSLIYLVGWLLVVIGAIGLALTGQWSSDSRKALVK